MSEETGTICNQCNEITTGKIYTPYVCADCKIKNLEMQVAELESLRRQIEKDNYELSEEREKYKCWYNECCERKRDYLKYKNAFQCLIKELGINKTQ